MLDIPKPIKRHLTRLAGEVYEAELRLELNELYDKFGVWKEGGLESHEICEEIHKFHSGPSRKMFNFYNDLPPYHAVAFGISNQLIQREDIPDDVWPYVERVLSLYEDTPRR